MGTRVKSKKVKERKCGRGAAKENKRNNREQWRVKNVTKKSKKWGLVETESISSEEEGK